MLQEDASPPDTKFSVARADRNAWAAKCQNDFVMKGLRHCPMIHAVVLINSPTRKF